MTSTLRSARVLFRHWKLTAIAIFSLSIAMALGVVSLSLSNTFLLLSPSAPQPDRLITIYSRSDTTAVDQVSFPDYQYFRENNHVFTDIAASPNSISLSEDDSLTGQTVKVLSRPVSANYLSVMGIRPFLGRFFISGEDRTDAALAVMTWSCWRRLGADPHIVGKKIASYTIVGVTPKEFTGSFYGLNGDLLTLMSRSDRASSMQRDARRLFLTARLKPGATRRQAQVEMTALAAQLAVAYPKDDKNRTAVVARATLLPPDGVEGAELALALLLAVVLLVLLIACANVANLLLAVAVGRRQEASIKLALGAPRGRLIREFLRESVILCMASGALGYGIAAAAIARYSDFTFTFPIYGAFAFALPLRLDGAVAAFTCALVSIAILATGLPPALYASSPHISQVLSGEIVVGGTRKMARRGLLVIAQVAICTLVLIGMGLCQRSLYNLRHVDPGFSARNLVAVQVYAKSAGYDEARGKQLYETLRRRVAQLPGVEAVSLASDLPLLGGDMQEVRYPDGVEKLNVRHTVVDADYFATFGIHVLAGRPFGSVDREGGAPTVVINRRMRDMLWPGQDPVGKVVTAGTPPVRLTVVGMVNNGKYDELDEEPRPFLYYPLSQHYRDGMNLIARTSGDPRLWLAPLAQVIRNEKLPIAFQPFTFDTWMNLTLLAERLTAGGVALLSGLGLLLAVIGLFGAISYSISERKKELGIRVALGARPGQLLTMVLRQTLRIAGVGVAIGIVLGIGVTMLVRAQLYGIGAVEWTVLVGVSIAMLAVALLVAWLSARSWTRIDPMEAVRHA
jgi:predicted permease